MKSRLAVSFAGVAYWERKHLGKKASGIRGARAPERSINWVFLDRLAFGPSPFGLPRRRIDRAFLGRLAFGSSPIGALGLGSWLGELLTGSEYVHKLITQLPKDYHLIPDKLHHKTC